MIIGLSSRAMSAMTRAVRTMSFRCGAGEAALLATLAGASTPSTGRHGSRTEVRAGVEKAVALGVLRIRGEEAPVRVRGIMGDDASTASGRRRSKSTAYGGVSRRRVWEHGECSESSPRKRCLKDYACSTCSTMRKRSPCSSFLPEERAAKRVLLAELVAGGPRNQRRFFRHNRRCRSRASRERYCRLLCVRM